MAVAEASAMHGAAGASTSAASASMIRGSVPVATEVAMVLGAATCRSEEGSVVLAKMLRPERQACTVKSYMGNSKERRVLVGTCIRTPRPSYIHAFGARRFHKAEGGHAACFGGFRHHSTGNCI